MPGSSLWLTPPPNTPLYNALKTLISKTVPKHFPNTKTYDFIPHITLTSDIDPDAHDHEAQKWLDGMRLPKGKTGPIKIYIEELEAGEPFVKKLTLKMFKESAPLDSLGHLAAICRAVGVEKGDMDKAREWAEKDYLPHLSLMYADIPASDVESQKSTIEKEIAEVRAELLKSSDDGKNVVCEGGVIVLVPTYKPIDEWEPIGQRELSHIRWEWPDGE